MAAMAAARALTVNQYLERRNRYDGLCANMEVTPTYDRAPASREVADLLRAALESPAGGALFAWNGGGPQSFQTPPSKDSSFRDDDEEASVPHRHRPGAPSPRRLAM